MDSIFLLRSYGDFVVALAGYQYMKPERKVHIIASGHLRALYTAIAETTMVKQLPEIEFADLDIQHGLMACFTNKYFFSATTIRELLKMRSYCKKIPAVDSLFLEQKKRAVIIRAFTGRDFFNVHDGSENIYDAYRQFFYADNMFLQEQHQPFNTQSDILLFPGSRKKSKRLPVRWVEKITDQYRASGVNITLTGLADEIAVYKGVKQVVTNFRELCALTATADYIISSDSLPAHLAYLFKKPLEVHYNGTINKPWLPPGAIARQAGEL